jgi:RecJ-like exonuclease
MRCEPCYGRGTVTQSETCLICNGLGYVDERSQCPDCGGSGYITGGNCHECNGSGTVNDEQCGSCGGSGKEEDRRCDRCETSGQITERRDCPITVETQVTCQPCRGTGEVVDPYETALGSGSQSGSDGNSELIGKANVTDCKIWRQQLDEKRSYRQIWHERQQEAQNELIAAGMALDAANTELAQAKSEIEIKAATFNLEKAQNLRTHWNNKLDEAQSTYSGLNDSFRDLEFRILMNCKDIT